MKQHLANTYHKIFFIRSISFRVVCCAIIALVASSCHRSDDALLRRLDKIVEQHSEIIERQQQRIDSVRTHIHATPFLHEMAMQEIFGSFSLDSAIYHARQAEKLAANDAELTRAKLALSRHYNSTGVMYKEADEVFNSISAEKADSNGLAFDRYSLAVQMNRILAEHSLDPDLKAAYLREKVNYRDSALMLQPDNEVLLANRYIDAGDYLRAIALMKKGDDESLTRNNAIRFNILAQLYTLQGDEKEAKKYLTLSASCDLSNAVREYMSLQELAMMLYREGDYKRAYRYINLSIEDATACNAKLRMLEMSTMLPMIEHANHDMQANFNRMLAMVVVLVILIVIVLFISINAIRRRNRQLAMKNAEQEDLNRRLLESDRIKEEYIARFMNLSLEYLAQMGSYKRNLLRVAAQRNFDKLCKAIESSRNIDEGINEFLHKFDEAFISIFPNFIEDFKALLRPDYEPKFKNGERLNTELRIYALMRLGFTDSDSICRFLQCSPSTVYNYRARIRSFALDRDTFDADVARIGRK